MNYRVLKTTIMACVMVLALVLAAHATLAQSPSLPGGSSPLVSRPTPAPFGTQAAGEAVMPDHDARTQALLRTEALWQEDLWKIKVFCAMFIVVVITAFVVIGKYSLSGLLSLVSVKIE